MGGFHHHGAPVRACATDGCSTSQALYVRCITLRPSIKMVKNVSLNYRCRENEKRAAEMKNIFEGDYRAASSVTQ